MNLTSSLREAVRPEFRSVEESELHRSIVSGAISRSLYGHFLWELRSLHLALARSLDQHPELAAHYDVQQITRTAALEADLARLCPRRPKPLSLHTTRLSARFEHWSDRDPMRLLGALYVFELARAGSLRSVYRLAQLIGVHCFDALVSNCASSARQAENDLEWKHFLRGLRRRRLAEEEQSAVLRGAKEAVQTLANLYQDLGNLLRSGKDRGKESGEAVAGV